MERTLETELLDELPPDDPRAVRSRKDLRRINALMGHLQFLSDVLVKSGAGWQFSTLVDLGAGDGILALKLARCLTPQIGPMRIILLDQRTIISAQTLDEFRTLGWEPEAVEADVFDWLQAPGLAEPTGIFANLFLHHFDNQLLKALFTQVAPLSILFAACEPRRSRLALGASHLLGLIGCNAVTRHDGVISVRAGFRGDELCTLWPDKQDWALREKETGPFTHLFVARQCHAESY